TSEKVFCASGVGVAFAGAGEIIQGQRQMDVVMATGKTLRILNQH
ncbi:hypothetical protein A2U01_0117899, partial [Trifolium medium]|nr:hypothetical protein [Trifolium medium]